MPVDKAGKKTLVQRIRKLFTIRETPRVVAGSVAAAVTWGTAPFFVGAAGLPLSIWLFRLNKVLAVGFTVILFANPFMLFLMVLQTWLGLLMLGDPVPAWITEFDFSDMVKVMRQSGRILVAYAVGGYTFAAVAGALTFGVLWPVLEWRKSRMAGKTAGKKGAGKR